MFEYVSSFPLAPRTPPDPTVLAANQRQREALLSAVAAAAGTSSPADPTIAAAMLDVLWSVVSYERLVAEWGLDPEDAIRGLTWVIGLVEDAIRAGHVRRARRVRFIDGGRPETGRHATVNGAPPVRVRIGQRRLRGSPSPRSAMIPRCTSLVPP